MTRRFVKNYGLVRELRLDQHDA
eukprot:SAG11_NODE_13476_length_653_cov_4.566787_2_plen_22_part_01